MHGHDNISIPMLKISGDFICKPLELIFSKALLTSMIPSKSKRDTISKTSSSNYFTSNMWNAFLKDVFLTKCLAFFSLINSFHVASPVLDLEIHVSTNFYQLPMKLMNHLIMN